MEGDGADFVFNHPVRLRITHKLAEQIEAVVGKSKGQYENTSHFIRCAIIKLLREHQTGRLD